jgi:formate-dependent nitrite reductase membrane component NrfD
VSQSITRTGSEMRSYYGHPVIKEPTWTWEIPVYFFTGGLGGASSAFGLGAKLFGNEKLSRTALYIGAAADAVSAPLLISDLGRPERFLNMLRTFKVTSPMSVGSWILVASSGATSTAAALELIGRLKPLKWAAELVSFASGPALATYTAALLANTANPVWSEARDELPWLFASSAAASAGAMVTALTPKGYAGPARRLALAGVAAELGIMYGMERKLGVVGEVYKQGEAGRYGRLAKACAGVGGAILAVAGKRSRLAAVAGGAIVTAGEVALRWSVFRAGFQSARDPKYTVLTQKARLAATGREG